MLIKRIGTMAGCLIGTIMSPNWDILKWTTQPYFDLSRASQNASHLLEEVFRFHQATLHAPGEVIGHLMFGAAIFLTVTILYLSLFGALGRWAAERLARQWYSA